MPYEGYSKKRNESIQKYRKESVDTFFLTMPKGIKEKIRQKLNKNNPSINGYINTAILDKLNEDK